jgi:hypothetical protein
VYKCTAYNKEFGLLPRCFCMHASKHTMTNLLCFSDVEQPYEIMYIPSESFSVHLLGRNIVFSRRDKLYIAHFA